MLCSCLERRRSSGIARGQCLPHDMFACPRQCWSGPSMEPQAKTSRQGSRGSYICGRKACAREHCKKYRQMQYVLPLTGAHPTHRHHGSGFDRSNEVVSIQNRAGRPQYDTEGVAVIMTDRQASRKPLLTSYVDLPALIIRLLSYSSLNACPMCGKPVADMLYICS